jgi:hypothetical protein
LEKASNSLLFCERYLGSVRASEEWVYKTRMAQSLDVLA